MTKTDRETIETLAAAALLHTLRQGANGFLKQSEADACAKLMAAYRDWSEVARKDELIERACELRDLLHAIGARAAEAGNLTEKLKGQIRAAVAQAVSETMTEEFAKQTTHGSRRRAPASKR